MRITLNKLKTRKVTVKRITVDRGPIQPSFVLCPGQTLTVVPERTVTEEQVLFADIALGSFHGRLDWKVGWEGIWNCYRASALSARILQV